MSDEKMNNEQDDLFESENVEIAPLSDEDLDSVAGGVAALDSDCTGCIETGCCTTGGESDSLS